MKEKHHEKIIHNRTPSLIIVCSIQAINKGKIHAQDAPYFRNKYSISDEEYMDGAFQWIIHLRMTFYHRISISPWSKDLIFQKVQRNQCLQFQPLYLKNQFFFILYTSILSHIGGKLRQWWSNGDWFLCSTTCYLINIIELVIKRNHKYKYRNYTQSFSSIE